MKIVVVTPSGRKKYLKKLFKHLELQKEDFDEWHLWENTTNDSDISYITSLAQQNPEWIKVIQRNEGHGKKGSIDYMRNFFDYTIDNNTIYIRLDDDIIWLEPGFIKGLAKFRKDNPTYFLVFGNIINNNVINNIQYKNGVFPKDFGVIDNKCTGKLWNSAHLCKKLHKYFVHCRNTNDIEKWKFPPFNVGTERVSINAISWIGGSFNEFGKYVGKSEEGWLCTDYIRKNFPGVTNIVYGEKLCVHHAYWKQRDEELDMMIDFIAAI